MKLKLSALFLLLVLFLNAQDYVRHGPFANLKFDKTKLYSGGNLGLQFGTSTFIDVSPLIGYRLTDKISIGVGATYQYYRYNRPPNVFETNVFGGRIFGRYFFTKSLFAHVEYETLNLQAYDLYPAQRVNVGSVLGGGGYMSRWNANSGMYIMALYNFTPSYYSPYSNPIIRIGFIIGF